VHKVTAHLREFTTRYCIQWVSVKHANEKTKL